MVFLYKVQGFHLKIIEIKTIFTDKYTLKLQLDIDVRFEEGKSVRIGKNTGSVKLAPKTSAGNVG